MRKLLREVEHARVLMSVVDRAPPVEVNTPLAHVKVVSPVSVPVVGLLAVPAVLVIENGRFTPLTAKSKL